MKSIYLKTSRFPGNSLRYLILLCLICPVMSTMLFAQGGRYTRKSVAYVDALLVTNDKIRINPADERYFLNTIHDGIRISRFDYNPLPETIHNAFKNQLQAKGALADSDLANLIETTIVPEILKILDLQKEIRAQNLVDETQRNSFIVIKAKEMGITADQIEQVMNASYLYLPFVSDYKVSKPKDDKNLTVSIKGGLLWYHVVTGDEPRIEKIVTLNSEASASAEKDRSDAESKAFREAASTLAMNLQVLTRDLKFFRLQTPIASVERRTVRFPLGKAEGIKLDEPYFVGEYVQTKSGKIRFQKSGFVRVSTVSDNRQNTRQLSAAYAVQKGDWVKGMTMMEHPRLGIDIAVKPRWFNMKIKEGVFLSDDFLVLFDNYDGIAVGADLDMQVNIAQLTHKRQSFIVIGATGAVAPVKSKIYDSFIDLALDWPTENWLAGVVMGYAGYLRRFYIGRLAVHGEALVGVQHLIISDTYDHETVTISNNSVGARINLGLEYAVNIDCNVGVFAGFQAFPPIDWWTIKYKDKEVDVTNYTGWAAPRISSISPTFGIYVHYSPPTLSFNPTSIMQAGMNQVK